MTTRDRPLAPSHLSGRHRHTYETIFRHPASHNLEWHDVRSLLAALSDVTEGDDGSLRATRDGRVLCLHAPKHKDVATAGELPAIRRFLGESGGAATRPPVAPGVHLLVVIDHHEAKVYRTESRGAVPQKLVPHDPHGFGRHLRSEDPEADGKRRPERKGYYEAVAATLRGAGAILIFGSGIGESSAMGHLLADLKRNHADVARHVVGSIVVDERHRTEGQLLAQAREFFASNRS